MADLEKKQFVKLPAHVGIIMDGNGRWAKSQGKNRSEGHRVGLSVGKTITKVAAEIGIQYLTLYAFSTENWKRARDEVSFLMSLIKTHLVKEMDFYRENEICVKHIGDRVGLPDDILSELDKVARDTKDFQKLTVFLAINYGGRNEIVRAVNAALESNSFVDESVISRYMDTKIAPDPDLIIRTAGEQRMSNFLTWQAAYSELYFCDKLWPEFSQSDFYDALRFYADRERKFGGVNE